VLKLIYILMCFALQPTKLCEMTIDMFNMEKYPFTRTSYWVWCDWGDISIIFMV